METSPVFLDLQWNGNYNNSISIQWRALDLTIHCLQRKNIPISDTSCPYILSLLAIGLCDSSMWSGPIHDQALVSQIPEDIDNRSVNLSVH